MEQFGVAKLTALTSGLNDVFHKHLLGKNRYKGTLVHHGGKEKGVLVPLICVLVFSEIDLVTLCQIGCLLNFIRTVCILGELSRSIFKMVNIQI